MDGLRFVSAVLLLSGSVALAAPPAGVAPASFSRETAQKISFGRQAAQVGQIAEQTIQVKLSLKARSRQGANVLDETDTVLIQNRKRLIETTQVKQGVTVAAKVRYLTSSRLRDKAPRVQDPIAGKTYVCRRLKDRLEVLTHDGSIPPADEFKLVSENMETLGRENPLASFLNGKQVAVGERLTLPPEVAKRLFGFSSQLGDVNRFDLTLSKIKEFQSRQCAMFKAEIEAQRTDASQMRMQVSGDIVIEAATCRAISSNLGGPIGMSHSVPDPRGRLQVDSTGRLDLQVSARFKDNPS